jgi:hypothetical protein
MHGAGRDIPDKDDTVPVMHDRPGERLHIYESFSFHAFRPTARGSVRAGVRIALPLPNFLGFE